MEDPREPKMAILPSPMASSRPTLKVSERTSFGSRNTRRMRREGIVPGIVYARGEEARAFEADGHDLALFLTDGKALFDLQIEGADPVPVVVKEQQRHPVRGELTHIDLHEVDLSVKIEADVSLELEGVEDAPGVKEGGVMEHITSEVTIFALPTDIPEQLTLDVSEMVIGDTVNLDSVATPDGVEFAVDSPEETTVATLNPPPVIEEPETDVEAEPELVGEEGDAEGDAGDGDESGGDADADSGDSED